jgi:hypothetical protein
LSTEGCGDAVPKNRIMIFGPKEDGTYVVEFRTAEGEALAISVPRSEACLWSENSMTGATGVIGR